MDEIKNLSNTILSKYHEILKLDKHRSLLIMGDCRYYFAKSPFINFVMIDTRGRFIMSYGKNEVKIGDRTDKDEVIEYLMKAVMSC